MPIASVEQATGIARATLRIWERRYGFPRPGRDPRGERSYPQEQVRKLQLVAQLLARGHRPGRLVQMSADQLEELAGTAGEPPADGGRAAGVIEDAVLLPLRDHDVQALLQLLEQAVRSEGLAGFVIEHMAPMNVSVGLAWARGELAVYEEHLYSEVAQQVVRAHLPPPAATGLPRALLATFPGESHGLGLLMAQALLQLEGCACTSLGTRVPVAQIATAASVLRADVVGLSFTASMNPSHVLRGLEQLRGELPPRIAVWAGGSSPVLARRRIAGVRTVAHIREVPALVAQWRREHSAS